MKTLNSLIGLVGLALGLSNHAALPPDYKGKPFEDSVLLVDNGRKRE